MRTSRGTALLLAPVGVVVGHALTEALVHAGDSLSSVAALPAVVVVLAVVSLAATGHRLSGGAIADRRRFGQHLMAQGLLLTAVELVEIATTGLGIASAPSLHDPVVWVGLAGQFVAAVAVHVSARLAFATVRRLSRGPQGTRPHARVVGPVSDCGVVALVGAASPRPIVGRAPPTARAFSPVRS